MKVQYFLYSTLGVFIFYSINFVKPDPLTIDLFESAFVESVYQSTSFNVNDLPNVSRTSIVCGDVSGNGAITATDASLILRHVTGQQYLNERGVYRADVTGNGTISAYDASWILMASVGLKYQADFRCFENGGPEKSNSSLKEVKASLEVIDNSLYLIPSDYGVFSIDGVLTALDYSRLEFDDLSQYGLFFISYDEISQKYNLAFAAKEMMDKPVKIATVKPKTEILNLYLSIDEGELSEFVLYPSTYSSDKIYSKP